MIASPISLIDEAYARRAKLAHDLASIGHHVEPYESLGEFIEARKPCKIMLIHDDGTSVAGLRRWSQENCQAVGILCYAEKLDPKAMVEAMKAGAFNYFDWPQSVRDLVIMLQECSDAMQLQWEKSEHQARARELIQRLTPRETQVLSFMAKGQTNKSISKILAISPRTVEIHRYHVLSKINAANSPDAVRLAFEAGLDIR